MEGEESVREKARWTKRHSGGGGERQMVRLEKRAREDIQKRSRDRKRNKEEERDIARREWVNERDFGM